MKDDTAGTASGHRKRLKARFLNSSLGGFHDYEAIELLLMFAIPRRDVKPLAKELLRRFGGFMGVIDAPVEELCEVPGIGSNTAMLIGLVRVAGQAYLKEQGLSEGTVACPEDAMQLIDRHCSGHSELETFCAIYLNSKNDVLGVEELHEGPFNKTSLSPRSVIEKAFKHNARSVIFVHRVDSDFAFPSMFERSVADGLKAAASAIDIIVHDYIVVARESHLSARESGLLKSGD